jgi:hypothetical protein
MLPLASASGPAIIVLVVICAALFLSWLLRTEKDEESGAQKGAETTDEAANQDR